MDTIEDNNKLIAEFMQLQTAYQDVQIWMDYENKTIPVWDNRDYWLARELKYHESWDWLMPVVERIEGLETPDIDNLWMVTIKRNYCSIGELAKHPIVELFGGPTKIGCAHLAIVEFIKNYTINGNTKK